MRRDIGWYVWISAAAVFLFMGKGRAAAEEMPEKVQTQGRATELSVLYSGSDVTWVAAMETLCDKFMEKNPDIIIYTENSGEASCENELKVKEALDEFPDLFELENVDTFAEAGRLGEIQGSANQSVLEPFRINGKVYGLPVYAITNGIIYNKNIFKEYDLQIPKNYEEFLEICEKLRENGIFPLALGGNQEENMLYWMNYFFQKSMISRIPDWLERRSRGEVHFTDEESIEMLSEYRELLSRDYFLEDSEKMTENQIVTKMTENQFAMLYAGPWLFSKIIDAYPMSTESDRTPLGEEIAREDDPVTYRLGWFFLGDDRGNVTALTENNAYWAASKECMEDPDRRKAAEKFLEFFYMKENYRSMIQGMYGLPVTKEAIIYPAPPAQQKLLKDYRYADKSSEFFGSTRAGGSFPAAANGILYDLYKGKRDAADTAKRLDTAWEQAIWEE